MKRGEVGKKGEKIVSDYLKEKGFQVLFQNYKNKYMEIDIIAKKNDVLHFVEVRSTATDFFGTPEETVRHKKIKKIKQNALAYITFQKYRGEFSVDLACVFFSKNGEVEKINYYESIIN